MIIMFYSELYMNLSLKISYLLCSKEKRPTAFSRSYVLGYVANGSHQSCITPIKPRSYIKGSVLGPLTGTTFMTQLLNWKSTKAAAYLNCTTMPFIIDEMEP